MSSKEKIAIKPWPFKLPQGGFTDLPKWKDQLPTQVLLASNLGESGATYLHYLTVYGKKARNRFVKPLLEPVEGEFYDRMDKKDKKRFEPVYLGDYLETVLDNELTLAVTKSKADNSKLAQQQAKELAVAKVEDNEVVWSSLYSFPNPPTPIQPTMSQLEEKDDENDEDEVETDQEKFGTPQEGENSIQESMDRTLAEASLIRLHERIRTTVTAKAEELRMDDLREKMTVWQAADSYLRMIMLKGIDEDPSGRLGRCETAAELKEAIDEYASASGVAIVATIRQMDTLFDWEWSESDSVQTNSRSLSETGDTYLRAFHALCPPTSEAGKKMKATLPAMKVAMLLARSNNKFSRQYSSVAAMERLQSMLEAKDVDFQHVYEAITTMLHQWESVEPTPGRANQTHANGRVVPKTKLDQSPCWVCGRPHVTKDCYCVKEGRIDEKMLENRKKKDSDTSGKNKKKEKKKQKRKQRAERAKQARKQAAADHELLHAFLKKAQAEEDVGKPKKAQAAKEADSDSDIDETSLAQWLGLKN